MPKRWVSQFASSRGVAYAEPIFSASGSAGRSYGYWRHYLCISANNLRQLYRLDRALERGKSIHVFETRGLWAEIFARINSQRR